MLKYLENTDIANLNARVQSRYQMTREMTLDEMLLDNRILFLIGEINYVRATEVIMKLLHLFLPLAEQHLTSMLGAMAQQPHLLMVLPLEPTV